MNTKTDVSFALHLITRLITLGIFVYKVRYPKINTGNWATAFIFAIGLDVRLR